MSTAIEPIFTDTRQNSPITARCGMEQSWVQHWDGRLDNRNDLLPLLADSLRGDTSNSNIALAAYQRWGISGLVHLIGDWSVVICDDANRATVLASDFRRRAPTLLFGTNGECLLVQSIAGGS